MPRTFFLAFDGSPPILTNIVPKQSRPTAEALSQRPAKKLFEFIDSMNSIGARSWLQKLVRHPG